MTATVNNRSCAPTLIGILNRRTLNSALVVPMAGLWDTARLNAQIQVLDRKLERNEARDSAACKRERNWLCLHELVEQSRLIFGDTLRAMQRIFQVGLC